MWRQVTVDNLSDLSKTPVLKIQELMGPFQKKNNDQLSTHEAETIGRTINIFLLYPNEKKKGISDVS